MHQGLWTVDTRESAAIVTSCHALAEIVCLHLRRCVSKIVPGEFPIDFVLVIGNQYGRADDADAWCCLHDNIDVSEEEPSLGPYVRRIFWLVECEFRAAGTEGDVLVVCEDPAWRKFCDLRKVDEVVARGKSGKGMACRQVFN